MTTLRHVKASMMNAIHDLPLHIARDEGFFRDEGLDVEIVKTGHGQRGADHQALRDNIFSRTMESCTRKANATSLHVRVGHRRSAVNQNVEQGHRPAKRPWRSLRHVDLRHRRRSEIPHLRASSSLRNRRSREPVQRLCISPC